MTDDYDAWVAADLADLWLFDKLILSRRLGYVCGPAGLPVPQPNTYVVRPVTNLAGMGLGARLEYLESTTTHLEPGYFWCEQFTGPHLSVDYEYGRPVLSVEGTREATAPLWRWKHWQTTTYRLPLPLTELAKFPQVNVEFIGGCAIEVHLRHNPDFQYGNTVAVPVWDDEVVDFGKNFVASPDYKRKGFYVNN